MSSPPTPATSASEPTRRPGRPSSHEAQDGDVRERLIASATELAVEQGFEACGLREIAARAGVSPGMISYYFGDRHGLYEAMFKTAFARISAQAESLLADPKRSGEDRINEFVRLQVSSIAADPWLPRLVMGEVLARADSPMRELVRETLAEGPIKWMIVWLEEEQARHGIREDIDPRMLAMTIGSLTGFPFLMLPLVGDSIGVEFDESFPERLIDHIQKLLKVALRAPSEDER